jgi:predicted ester cyclase
VARRLGGNEGIIGRMSIRGLCDRRLVGSTQGREPPERGTRMGVEDNKKTVQLIEEAWNRNDVGALDQHFSPKFDNSASVVPGMPIGLDTAKQIHGISIASFPDRKTEVLELIGEGDKVMARVRTTGTNTGGVPHYGAEANNAKVDFEWISIYTFDGKGKVVAHRGLNDAYLLGIQLGAITPPDMAG